MKHLVIRIPEELKKRLQSMAAADNRKLSDYVRIQLEKIVKQEKREEKTDD